MNTDFAKLSGHLYAPGQEPTWWEILRGTLARYGLAPESAAILLLLGVLIVWSLRRLHHRRSELRKTERAIAEVVEADVARQAMKDAVRELRLRRAAGGMGE